MPRKYGWIARWRYDFDNGELQKISIGGYRHVAYVSQGLSGVSRAVGEFRNSPAIEAASASVGNSDCASSEWYSDSSDESDDTDSTATTHGEDDTDSTDNSDESDDSDDSDDSSESEDTNSCTTDDTDETFDRRILEFCNGFRAFYDPADGEWGVLDCDYRTYGHTSRLKWLLPWEAKQIVYELLQDRCEKDEEDEDDEDYEHEDPDVYDLTFDEEVNRFRLFKTYNRHPERRDLCVGLVMYWLIERLTTCYSLEESRPDYDESLALHYMYKESTIEEVARSQNLKSDMSFKNSLDKALDEIFEERGAYILTFQPTGTRGHAVGVFTSEDEVGYFDPNHGVCRTPDVVYCKTLMLKHIDGMYPGSPDMELELVRLFVSE